LGYKKTNDMTKYLDSDELSIFNWKIQKQDDYLSLCFKDYKYKANVPIISETGIYEAISNLRKKEANEFKKMG